MKDWFRFLLPPYSIARLFAAYRLVEARAAEPCAVCAVKDTIIADMRKQLEIQQNYTLSLLGQRPINVPDKQMTATVTAGRPTLAAMRRSAVNKAVAGHMAMIDDEGMASRADEYAEQIKGKSTA